MEYSDNEPKYDQRQIAFSDDDQNSNKQLPFNDEEPYNDGVLLLEKDSDNDYDFEFELPEDSD
jgi:hypothetical protein